MVSFIFPLLFFSSSLFAFCSYFTLSICICFLILLWLGLYIAIAAGASSQIKLYTLAMLLLRLNVLHRDVRECGARLVERVGEGSNDELVIRVENREKTMEMVKWQGGAAGKTCTRPKHQAIWACKCCDCQ